MCVVCGFVVCCVWILLWLCVDVGVCCVWMYLCVVCCVDVMCVDVMCGCDIVLNKMYELTSRERERARARESERKTRNIATSHHGQTMLQQHRRTHSLDCRVSRLGLWMWPRMRIREAVADVCRTQSG